MTDWGNSVETKRVCDRLQVRCPFTSPFKVFALASGARWRYRTRKWSFPIRQYPLIAKALNRIYDTALPLDIGSYLKYEDEGVVIPDEP